MNYVNGIRFLGACFAMVFTMGTFAEEPRQVDRLDLDSSSITGNQELPKVMYIVPWKEADIGDLRGKPTNSLIDEVLAPLDRDVFRRQVRYFGQLNTQDSGAAEAAE